MPLHNFMLEDLAGSLKAICLFPAFVLLPGYILAWLLDLFEFRRRTAVFRTALSIPLSIAVCPIVTYLAGRFLSVAGVWIFYAAAAALFVVLMVIARPCFALRKDLRIFAAIAGLWLVVCLVSLIDIQVGNRLYYPTSALDNSIRAAFIHSIGTTGIPPQSPFFLPAQPVPLRYHYFWLMMCSLPASAARGAVSARQALIAGTFWCGSGLMALVALYLRLASPQAIPPAFAAAH